MQSTSSEYSRRSMTSGSSSFTNFRRAHLSLLAGATLMPTLWLVVFGASGRDDSFITFGMARSLAEAGKFINLNGDPVEGSTTLGYVLILALMGAMQPEAIPLIGWAVSFIMLGVAGICAYIIVRRSNPRVAFLGALFVWVFPPLAYWSASGSETTTTFVILLIAILLVGTSDSESQRLRPFIRGVFASAVFWMRPDVGLTFLAILAIVAVGSAIVKRLGQEAQPVGLIMATVGNATGVTVVCVFRLIVFDSPLPQPVLAKIGGAGMPNVGDGIAYVEPFLRAPYVFAWILITAIVTPWFWRHLNLFQWMLYLQAALGFLVVVLSGGDWMEWGRLLAIPLACLVILGVSLIPNEVPVRVTLVTGGLILLANLFALRAIADGAGLGSTGSYPSTRWDVSGASSKVTWPAANSPYVKWNGVHLRDSLFLNEAIPVISEELRAAGPKGELTLASEQAGMNFYYLSEVFGDRLQFVDLYQLTTHHFDECRGLEKNQAGRKVTPEYWAANAGECAPDMPHFIIDVGYPQFADLPEYEVVVEVTGDVTRPTGARVPVNQFLVVRKHADDRLGQDDKEAGEIANATK